MSGIRKIVLSFVLAGGLLFSSALPARAQFIVSDPGNQAQSIMNAFMQLAEAMTQTGILDGSIMPDLYTAKKLFDEQLGEGSTYNNLLKAFNDAKYLKQLVKLYNEQLKYQNDLIKDLPQAFGSCGLNYSTAITPLIYQMTSSVNTIKAMTETLTKILQETGLSKGEKKETIERSLVLVEEEMTYKRLLAEYEVSCIEQAASSLQLINFLTGQDASYGMGNIVVGNELADNGGSSVTDRYAEDIVGNAEGSVGVGQVVKDSVDMSNLNTATKNFFLILALMFGIFAAISTLLAYLRYTRGDYGSGDYGSRGFVRIAVAAFIFALVFSLLTKCAG